MDLITYRKTLDVQKSGVQFMLQGFETADKMSRRIIISLMANGDTIDLPLEQLEAVMYVSTPGIEGQSVNKCSINGNNIIYDVLPITREGVTTMQLKLIETTPEGPRRVLGAPKFAVEVSKSEADDESIEETATFTALEEATAKAKAVYDERVVKIEITDDCIFVVHYADGTTYETDAIRKMLLKESTNLDLEKLIKNGIANFTADEVAEVLDEKYSSIFGKAILSSNLLSNYPEATFVQWDTNTLNTPFKAALTKYEQGFAIVFGAIKGNHTIVAWTMGGDKLESFNHYVIDGTDKGWYTLNVDLEKEVSGILDIEHGGTGGTTAKEAQENLGITTLTEMTALLNGDVLWENPDPTAEFSSQTIALDLKGYKKIAVVGDEYDGRVICYEKDTVYKLWRYFLDGAVGRTVKFNDTGVTIGSYSASMQTNNELLIPQKIIGYKY